ncbi:MAG: 4Fe-4S dicluster domain-containing protein [Deltaproteobacteria bacterium]|nr:4Fe-4S dicluster domain-containing protein [Deltaproteobacteria bacterium]
MKTIAKENVKDLLRLWTKQYQVLVPTRTTQGDCIFDTFQEDSFTLDYKKPPLPPKSVFFPHNEVIFQVVNNEFREIVSANNTILFGIRSCDMMGLLQCVSFMTRDRKDIYYSAKKDTAITAVMACPGPQNETCFCTTTFSGPVAEKGFDLLFYDMDDVFMIEAGSQQGKDLLSSGQFIDVDDTIAREKIEAFKKKAVQSIPLVDEVNEAMNRLEDGTADEKVWERFGRKCIVCGGCAFVCPTCTCFNVYDHETAPGRGVRARTWDACLYGGFTREASGHNPRSTQASRLKRRHEHKLLYYNKTDIQESLCGCVGCGRCSDYCPVHIGTLEVVKEIAAK